MATRSITIERFSVKSAKPFAEVLHALERGISRPNMSAWREQTEKAVSFSEYEKIIQGAVGEAGLMEFLRLDLGDVLRRDPSAKAYQIVRIIAGNPLIMKQMVEHLPDAGSYAPVTILVYEQPDGVHLSYDLMASYLAPYQNDRATEVANDLDAKVTKLLIAAAA